MLHLFNYKKKFRKEKATSTPVTTIILVVIGISLALTLALIASNIFTTNSQIEKVQVTNLGCYENQKNLTIKFEISNKGSAAATITSILVNGKPAENFFDYFNKTTQKKFKKIHLNPGETKKYTLIDSFLNSTERKIKRGVTYQIIFQTAKGNNYIKQVTT